MRRAIARGRVFPQSYSTDRRYGRLSLKAIGLFPLIWANADDQGRLCGDPEEIKYTCCPNIDHITKADVPGLLEELERHNLIRVYETPRSAAIQILDWWDIQKPQWAWPSEYPPLNGWKDRLRYKKDATTVVTENWPSSGERQNSAQVSSDATPGESRNDSQVGNETASAEGENQAQASDKINPGENKNNAQASHKTASGENGNVSQLETETVSGERPKHAQVNGETSSGEFPGEFSGESSGELSAEKPGKPSSFPHAPFYHPGTEREYEKESGNRNSGENSPERSPEFSPEKPPPDGGLPDKGLFENLLEQIKSAPDRKEAIAGVGELYRVCAGRAPPYGRIGVIARKANYDFGYLARLIWETTSARPSGDLLSYVEGRMKGERRVNEQRESTNTRRGAGPDRKDPVQAFRDAGGTVIISGEEAEAGNEDG